MIISEGDANHHPQNAVGEPQNQNQNLFFSVKQKKFFCYDLHDSSAAMSDLQYVGGRAAHTIPC